MVHPFVVNVRVVHAAALIERRAVLLEVRAVVPAERIVSMYEPRCYVRKGTESTRENTHSGPTAVTNTMNAAATPMRIFCAFA
jgi:hypothetical protein